MANTPIRRRKLGAAPVPEDWMTQLLRKLAISLKKIFGETYFNVKHESIEDVFTGQISVGTTVRQIVPPNPNRNCLTIKNHGSGSVWIGSYEVTTTTGYKLPLTAGDNVLALDYSWGAVYAISDSSATISFIEE
jgi:hypothetical protein